MKKRSGWIWKETANGGYWMRVVGESLKHKKSFFCPHCRRPTGTVDDKYVEEYGVCYLCYTMHIDARETPAIDLSKYKK